MAQLTIITIPKNEQALRQKSKDISIQDISTPNMQRFFDELSHTMFKADGVGLAAIQVNKAINVMAVNIGDAPYIFINPQIIKKSFLKDIMEEGCLSIPGVYGKVKRHKKITLKYLDRQGKAHITKFTNFTARVIQHELDHLKGILFIDKIIK